MAALATRSKWSWSEIVGMKAHESGLIAPP